MPAGHLALLQVGVVAAAVEVDLPLGEVEFEDLGDRAGEELAVVADDDGPGAQAAHEPFEAFEAVQVEVVGRLVEQEDVVAGQQQRGESRAGGLAAGQGGHRLVEADVQAEDGGDLLGAFVEVGAAEREPPLQGGGVGVVRAGRAVDQALGGLVHGVLGLGDAGAAGQEGAHGLAGPPLRLLREVADGGGGRGEPQLALLGRGEPGEQAQQRGLAGAVGSDQADHVAGRDDEVEPGEQGAVAVSGGEVLGDEGGSHQTADLKACRSDRPGVAGPGTHSPTARRARSRGAPGGVVAGGRLPRARPRALDPHVSPLPSAVRPLAGRRSGRTGIVPHGRRDPYDRPWSPGRTARCRGPVTGRRR
ncbi:hypothetical protein STENM223S_02795 [Streptomyces tendae]